MDANLKLFAEVKGHYIFVNEIEKDDEKVNRVFNFFFPYDASIQENIEILGIVKKGLEESLRQQEQAKEQEEPNLEVIEE